MSGSIPIHTQKLASSLSSRFTLKKEHILNTKDHNWQHGFILHIQRLYFSISYKKIASSTSSLGFTSPSGNKNNYKDEDFSRQFNIYKKLKYTKHLMEHLRALAVGWGQRRTGTPARTWGAGMLVPLALRDESRNGKISYQPISFPYYDIIFRPFPF